MVTIAPQFSRELLGDRALQASKIGPGMARAGHLDDLTPVEALVRSMAPLPASYDINRLPHLNFHEYTYTELMGSGLLVSPQSIEASARLVQMALDRPDQGFDAASAIMARGPLDKYRLDTSAAPQVKAVAFVPGTNMFRDMVSTEALARAMHEDDELLIKPHPISHPDLIGHLCSTFGPHRVIEPKLSGHACLMAAERVYALSTTEMGLYAVLMSKPVRNIGNFWLESRGAYSALYRPLWGKSVEDAKAALTHILNSPFSGFMHKDDPDLEGRLATYYGAAMGLRDTLKPLTPTPAPMQAPAAK